MYVLIKRKRPLNFAGGYWCKLKQVDVIRGNVFWRTEINIVVKKRRGMCETKRPSAEEGGDEKTSSIPDFYNGRSVLVTGATGFMGKVLVEKLLRSCPGIKTMFDRLRNERPGFGSQLVAIRGDVTSENLGLSKEDRMLLEQKVSIIFHCAANVRFDQKLKNAIHFNTLGTQRVLQLAETVHKLDAFIHVSTAYCHCDQTILEEKLYAPPTDAKNILQMVEWMDDDIIDTITPKLIGEQPNTYAYSKNLTEQLVASYSGKFPGGLEVLQYYTTKEWVFHNDNLKSLPGQLNEKDRETFFTDIKKVDWDSYIKNFVLGTRHYFLKEDPATLPQARKHMKRLYWVDRTFSFLFYCLLLWTLLSWSDQIISISRSTFQALPRVFNLMPIIRIMPDAFGADSVPTS
ncbi:hypothetical protein C0J52_21752 [Blattella germanica]|nr:hypothetical protein C0J52_21752 [Blattella germanica]